VSPHPTRYYGDGDLHFICFLAPVVADLFLRALEAVRRQYRFVVVGYVVMPEHVHLLLSEPERRNLSVVLKALKQGVARRVLSAARRRNRSRQTELFPAFRCLIPSGRPVSMTSMSGVAKRRWRSFATCIATR
jgi:REP element-mobilizing transposase RayT